MARIPKNFAVIGDIHARAHEEGEHIDKFIHAVNWVDRQRMPLYIVGDVIEGYDPYTGMENINPYVRATLLDALSHTRFMCGNHDNTESGCDAAPEYLHDKNRKVLLLHGQRFDFWFQDEETEAGSDAWGKMVYKVGATGLIGFQRFLRKVSGWGFVDRAMRFMDTNNLRLMVTGHTHQPMVVTVEGKTLATGGAWGKNATDNERMIVVVDGLSAELYGLEDMK